MLRKESSGILLALAMVCFTCPAFASGLPADAEAATHGDEAASVQPVAETAETTPDFVFRQYNLAVLSHYSYLIASGGEALIVDPARDISRYLKDAQELGVTITRVYLTHSHADFVAGHSEVSAATGASVLVNKATEAGYPHEAMEDGQTFEFGNVKCKVLTTPGHTPDGTCLAVYHPASSADPRLVLTGDTLFIGSVGRPDLMGGAVTAADLAAMAYKSWTEKLSKLPDATLLFPAHGAGSLCGAHLSDKPVSTFGEQKRDNAYLQHRDLYSFIMAMIDGLPEAPQYFKHNAKINHDGPPLVDWTVPLPPPLNPEDLQTAPGAWVVDIRSAADYAAGHIPGSINIGLRGRFETWTGIMIPWGEPFVLLGAENDVAEAAFRLHRIGYDSPKGYLTGGLQGWVDAGFPLRTIQLVAPADLYRQMQEGAAPIVVDVRLPAEWMALRISQNLLNMPVNKLFAESKRLDPAMPVLTVCNSAYRSSMAASVLEKAGFTNLRNMEGGSEAWIEAGLPTFGSAPAVHGDHAAPAVFLNLPERVSPRELAQRLMDLPGTLDVIDIRPAPQFREYSIPGSVNVPAEQALNNPAYLNDRRPLVIVCRDGFTSASVAGALVPKTQRPIRFLAGGVAAYYDAIVRPLGIRDEATPLSPQPASTDAPAVVPAVPPATAAPAPGAPPKPTKKSAGC